MGNNSSTKKIDERNFLADFNKNFKLLKEWDDSKFGEVKWFKHKTEESHVLQKERWSNTEKEFKAFVQQCDERLTNNHKNLLKLITYRKGSEENICGDFNKITLFFEYHSHDLQKEIDQRANQKEFLTEPEIWYLLLSLITAAQSLEKRKIYHGEIRAENVLLTPEGFVKLTDNSLIGTQTSAYARALSGTIDSLLSPRMLFSLSKKESKPRHDSFKSDVFSLGLTILHAATLENVECIYDHTQRVIDLAQLQRLYMIARSKYSEFLINFIMEMLNQDEVQRPSFQSLSDILSPYEAAIREMKPFQYIPHQRLGRYQAVPLDLTPKRALITKSPLRTVSPAQVIQQAIPAQMAQSHHRTNSPNFNTAKSPIRVNVQQIYSNVSPRPANNQFSPRGPQPNLTQSQLGNPMCSATFQFSPNSTSFPLQSAIQPSTQFSQVLQTSTVPVHISQQLGGTTISGLNQNLASLTSNQNILYTQNPNFSSNLNFSSHHTIYNGTSSQSSTILPSAKQAESQVTQQQVNSTSVGTDSSTVDISLSEIDKRVNEALKNSEETIRKHSNLAATAD